MNGTCKKAMKKVMILRLLAICKLPNSGLD